jgi:hypothetical protein
LLRAHYGAREFARHIHDELVIVITETGCGSARARQLSDRAGHNLGLRCRRLS